MWYFMLLNILFYTSKKENAIPSLECKLKFKLIILNQKQCIEFSSNHYL